MVAENNPNGKPLPEISQMAPAEMLAEILTRVREWDQMVADLQPLLAAWRSTNGGTVGVARAAWRVRSGRHI